MPLLFGLHSRLEEYPVSHSNLPRLAWLSLLPNIDHTVVAPSCFPLSLWFILYLPKNDQHRSDPGNVAISKALVIPESPALFIALAIKPSPAITIIILT